MNLSRFGKCTRVSNAAAAATTDVTSSSVDMQGFDSVTFYVSMGAIVAGAVTSVHAEQSADDSSFADLEGTNITIADDDDNQVVILEIEQPSDRYVRVIVDRATQNATVDSIVAIQTKANKEPVTHDATTVVGAEYHLNPSEGTI